MKTRFLLLSAAMILPTAAYAQDADNASGGDIVVTANRIESLASKTPIALTAIKGDQLISSGITNPTALGEQVPNLSIDRNIAGGIQITIRGVSSSDNTEKGDPSAAFMADGIYIARPQAQEVSFFDVARVEVLRGPQGTLYGRNTTAGLVNVITNKPVLGEFSGRVDAAYGNYSNTQLIGVINLPVGDKVALRIAGNWDQRDNFVREGANFTTSLDPYKDNISVRASALFDLDNGELLLRGDYSSLHGLPTGTLPTGQFFSNFNTPGVAPTYIGGGVDKDLLLTNQLAFSDDLFLKNSTWGVQAALNYDLGPVTLSYDGSYRSLRRDERNVGAVAGVLPIVVTTEGKFWQTSHELRLATSGSGPFEAQAGVYYFKERATGLALNIFGLLNPVPGQPGYVFGFRGDFALSESYAGFGQATYSVTEALRLTAGVRYTHDKKARVGGQVICSTVACNGPFDFSLANDANRTFTETTWRAGLDYDVNDSTLLYASVSTGYKAGGFNDGCEAGTGPTCALAANALYYDPEKLTAYEAGLKTRLLDNALQLNLSAFHYDYSDLQLSQASTACGGPCLSTSNVGKAKVDGVEAEAVVQAGPNTRFDLSFAYTNARYTRFTPAPGFDFAGKKLDRAPEVMATAGVTQKFPLANGGNFEANLRTRMSGSYYIAATSTLNQFRIQSYTRTDAVLTYNAPGNSWYLQGYVKNLENSIVVTTASSGPFGSVSIADPRTYGVRAGLKF